MSGAELQALQLSLQVAAWSVAFGLPLALLTALLLARGRFPGKVLLDGLVHLPLVLPPVVTGYLLLLLLGRRGLVGEWLGDTLGIVFAFNWTGAVLAAVVMSFPLMVRPMRLSIEAVDGGLEQAAATLGGGRLWVLSTVTLPLALPGVLAGAVLGFARSLGEFGATITFVSSIPGETRTLPSAIYAFTQTIGGDAAAMRLTIIAVLISLVAIVASEVLARRLRRRVQGL